MQEISQDNGDKAIIFIAVPKEDILQKQDLMSTSFSHTKMDAKHTVGQKCTNINPNIHNCHKK